MCNDPGNSGSEPDREQRGEAPEEPPGWVRRDRLTLPEAQDLLDWLDANQFREREMTYHPAHGFTVRWHQRRPGEMPDPTPPDPPPLAGPADRR